MASTPRVLSSPSLARYSSLKLGKLSGDERVKLLTIRLAFIEKLASRIGATGVLWGTAVVLGAFGTLINFTDLVVVSITAFAESFRLFVRSHEVEVLAISRDSPGDHEGRAKLNRAEFSVIPIPYISNHMKPQSLSRMLYVGQICAGLACIALPIWRVVRHDFCERARLVTENQTDCSFALYLYYALIDLAATIFLVEKVCFKCLVRGLRRKRIKTNLNPLVVEKFCISVYTKCLEGSIFDGFDMNLAVFGIQWLQSDEFEKQLQGAKLLSGLTTPKDGKHEATYEYDSQISDRLVRLGTYPGLMHRLVEMLIWDSKELDELVDEVAAIVRDMVAFDHNCSRFVAVPGALDAVVSLMMRRANSVTAGESDSTRLSNSKWSPREVWEACQEILRRIAANQSISGRALHQHLMDMVVFTDDSEDHEATVTSVAGEGPHVDFAWHQGGTPTSAAGGGEEPGHDDVVDFVNDVLDEISGMQ